MAKTYMVKGKRVSLDDYEDSYLKKQTEDILKRAEDKRKKESAAKSSASSTNDSTAGKTYMVQGKRVSLDDYEDSYLKRQTINNLNRAADKRKRDEEEEKKKRQQNAAKAIGEALTKNRGDRLARTASLFDTVKVVDGKIVSASAAKAEKKNQLNGIAQKIAKEDRIIENPRLDLDSTKVLKAQATKKKLEEDAAVLTGKLKGTEGVLAKDRTETIEDYSTPKGTESKQQKKPTAETSAEIGKDLPLKGLAEKYGEDSFIYQSALQQAEDPNSKLNQLLGWKNSVPEKTDHASLENQNAWNEWLEKGKQLGQFDRSEDVSRISDAELDRRIKTAQNKKDEYAANHPQTEEERKELNRQLWEIDGQNIYAVLDNVGIDTGMRDRYDNDEWKTIRTDKRPADYYESDEKKWFYDEVLYDEIHGDGAYWARVESDEDGDVLDKECDELWERLENKTLEQLPEAIERDQRRRDIQGALSGSDAGIDKELQTLQAEKDRRTEQGQLVTGARGLKRSADFKAPEAEERWTTEGESYYYVKGDKTDESYFYIDKGYDQMMQDFYGSSYNPETMQPHWSKVRNEFFMTDAEKRVFKKYYESGDKASAQAYLDGLHTTLNGRKAEYQEEYQREKARGPLGFVEGIGTTLVKPVAGIVGTVGTVAAALGNKEAADPNSDWHSLTRYTKNTRDERGEVWGEGFENAFGEGGRGVGRFLNGIAYSMADNLVAMGLTKGMGAAAGFDMAGKTATRMIQGIMSMEATADTMEEQLRNKNRTPLEAAVMAIGGGAIEAVTERYSIEALLKPNIKDILGNGKQLAKFIGKNMIAEGSEEVASDVLNTGLDIVVSMVSGHENEIQSDIHRLQRLHPELSEDEAGKQVLMSRLRDTGMSFLGGALSGGIMGGTRAGSTKIGSMVETRDQAKAAVLNDRLGMVINAAEKIDGGEGYAKIVSDARNKFEKNGNLTPAEARKLFGAMKATGIKMVDEVATNEMNNVVKEQIEAQLEKNGTVAEQADIDTAVGAATELLIGEGELNGKQKAAMRNVPEAMEVVQSILTAGTKANVEANRRLRESQATIQEGMQSIREAAEGDHATFDVREAQENANIATDEDIRMAKGQRTGSRTEVIVDGEYGVVTKKTADGYTVKTADGEKIVQAEDLLATNGTTGTVIRFAQTNGSMLSDKFVTTMLASVESGNVKDAGTFLRDAVNIRMSAYTGLAMPQTSLRSEIAQALYSTSQLDAQQAEENRVKNNVQAKPGEGRATFNGAEYGTSEWNAQMKDLNKTQRNQAGALAEIFHRIGLNVNIVNDESQDWNWGAYDAATGTTTINLAGTETDGTLHHGMVTAGHELVHWLEMNSREGYAALRDYVLKGINRQGGNVNQRILNTIDSYNSQIEEMDGEHEALGIEDAIAEMVANGADQILSNDQVIEAIRDNDQSLYNEIKGFVKNFVARVKNAISGMSRSASWEARFFLNDMNELANKWLGAYDDALKVEEPKAEPKTDLSFSLREYPSSAVEITPQHTPEQQSTIRNYLGSVDSRVLAAAKEYKQNRNAPFRRISLSAVTNEQAEEIRDVTGFDVQGYKHDVDRNFFNHVEDRHGENGKQDQTMADLNDVARVGWVIDNYDRIEPATDEETQELARSFNYMDKDNQPMPMIRYIKQVDGTLYVVEAVGENKWNKLHVVSAYMQKNNSANNNSQSNAVTRVPHAASNLGHNVRNAHASPAGNSVTQAEGNFNQQLQNALENPKKSFSMRQPIEANKAGLIAVHNLTWENLWDTLNEGGFTAPSIAVIKAAMGHTKYGEISAVFKPSAIDPAKNRLNKIYGADAYTPTRYNAHVETELEYKKLSKISDEIAEYVKGMDEHLYNEVQRWFSEQAYREVTTKTPQEMADEAYNNEALMASYLKSQGKDVQIKTRERFANQNLRAEDMDTYQKAFELIMDNADLMEFMEDVDKLSGKNLIEKYAEVIAPANERISTLLKLWNEKGSDLAGKTLMRWLQRTRDYIRGGSEKVTEPDWYETRKAMWDEIDRKAFTDWLVEKITPMFGQKGIRNNLDPFTYAGNARTFKQLHTPYTIENVVKAMYQNAKEKGEGGRYAKGVAATASKEYRNLQEVREDAGRLRIEDDEAYDAIYEKLDQKMRELGNEIMPEAKEYFDEVLMTAGKYYARSQSVTSIIRGFAEEQYKITPEQAEKVKNLLDELREVPTGYFEAKPMRVMGFDTLEKIIIPEKAGDMMFKKLDDNNIPYETYDGTEEDRLKKLNAQENAKFSLRQANSEYMQAVKSGDAEKAQELVDRAAKDAGYTMKVYHGTPYGGFNEFNDWSYFTENKAYADRYNHPSQSSIRGRYDAASNPMTYALYMNPGRVFDTRNKAEADLYNKIRMELGMSELNESGLPDWVEGRDLIDYIEENDLPYDTIILDEGADGGYGQEVVKRGNSYVTRSENVKSAEAITRDDNGNVIPLDERFRKESRDIRHAFRTDSGQDVNAWMMGLNESQLKSDAEKKLLKDYKGLKFKIELSQMKVLQWNNRIREIQAMDHTTAEQRDEARKLRINIETERKKQERLQLSLDEVTSAEGYAGMMYRQHRMMNDFVTGRTRENVKATVKSVNDQIRNVQEQMDERAERLKALAGNQFVVATRSFFDKNGLKAAAAKLKEDMGSTLATGEIENALAEIAMKRAARRSYDAEAEALAGKLIEKAQGSYDSYVLSDLRGSTFLLSEAQLKELKGQDSSLKEINRELSGTGIRVESGKKGATTLDMVWEELCDRFPQLDRDCGDLEMLNQLMRLIESEKNAGRGEWLGALEPTTNLVKEAAAGLIPNMPKDAGSRSQIQQIFQYMSQMAGEAMESARQLGGMHETMDRLAERGIKAQGAASILERDVENAIEYYNLMNRQAEQASQQARERELIDQLESEATERVLAEAEKWKKAIDRDKTARGLREDNMALRKKVHTVTKRLNKLLTAETDQQNIPEYAKPLAKEMLRLIVDNDVNGRKITGMDPKDLMESQRILNIWKASEGRMQESDLDFLNRTMPDGSVDTSMKEAVMDALAEIEDGIGFYNAKSSGDIRATLQGQKNALARIQKAVSTIYTILQTERSIWLGDKRIETIDQAWKVDQGTKNSRFKGENVSKTGRAMAAIHKAIVSGNMTPEYFFKNLKNEGISELYEEYHRGENKYGLLARQAKERLAEIADRHGYGTWDTKKQYTLKLANGGSVNMTLEQLMALWATWKREQTIGPEESYHLTKGGFYIEDRTGMDKAFGQKEKRTQKAYRVKEEDMSRVEGMLTDEQKAYVDDIVDYMSRDMSQLGNEASLRMYGIKKYGEKYYFPMKIWDGVKSQKSDAGAAGQSDNRAAHKGWSKRRINRASNALVIGDFTTEAAKHVGEMIAYNTMAPAVENMNKVLNTQLTADAEDYDAKTQRNIRAIFAESYGKEALEYLERFMADINGGAVKNERTFYDSAISMFRKNAVAGSLSVAAQQPLSYIRAATMMNPKYLAQAMAREYWKGAAEELRKYSGVAVIKDMGRFDMNAGQTLRDFIQPEAAKSNGKKAYDFISEKSTILPELMDRWTWTRMWVATKLEQAAKHPEMDTKSDEFLRMAAERFNEIMRKTQVYDSVLVRSSNMRSKSNWVKALTSFMAEPTLTANVLYDAVVNAGEKGGKAKLAAASMTFMLSAILQAAVKAGFSTGRSPDDDKTWLENFLNRFGTNIISEANPMALVPGYSDAIELIKKGELSDDAMGALAKIINATRTGVRWARGKSDTGDGYRDFEDSIAQLAQLFTNVPAKNLMRDGRAIYNWVVGDKYANRPTSAAVLKYQAIDAFANSDTLMGAFNSMLEDAGYETGNAAYYQRIYDAKKAGNTGKAGEMSEYLMLGRGVKEKTIGDKMNALTKADESLTAGEKVEALKENGYQQIGGYVKDQYKEGNLEREEAEKLYREANPKATDKSVMQTFDAIDYGNAGGEADNYTNYTPLYEAIGSNDVKKIDAAVGRLLDNGYDKKTVRSQIKSKYRDEYLALKDGSAEKVAMKDALTKAYKATGMSVEAINRQISTEWKKEAEEAAKNKGKNDVKEAYSNGEIGKAEAQKRYQQNVDGATADDAYWAIDRIDYYNETGESASGTYYRLKDAINNGEDIEGEVKRLTQHGVSIKNVRDKIDDWKKEYLDAPDGSSQETTLGNRIKRAYQATGMSSKEAQEKLDGWKTSAEKAEAKAAEESIEQRYLAGKITRSQAEAELRKAQPNLVDNDVWYEVDRMDFKKTTGKDPGGTTYYRIYHAIETGDTSSMAGIYQDMAAHGAGKSWSSTIMKKYGKQYMEITDEKEKIRFRNVLEQALKAGGVKNPGKTINNWVKKNK